MSEQYYMDATGVVFRQSGLGGRKPVVVLDPEDREQVERLVSALEAVPIDLSDDGDANELQAALRSLVSPPKPDEPQGLGAVVEDEEGRRWLRCFGDDGYYVWRQAVAFDTARVRYADINVARVLSEGVQP